MGPSAIDVDWMISVDDHVVEPADLWSNRLPSKLVSAGPRVETLDTEQVWVFGNKKKAIAEQGARLFSKAGMRDLLDIPRSFDDLRPGCCDPRERVKDMDAVNVSASLCFPSFPRFAGQEFLESDDRTLALECVRIYNDWMIDEWCGAAPGRLIPLVIVPLWDVDLACHEIERTAAKGAKAFTFPENPYKLGLPSIYDKDKYWEPLLRTAAELGMPACTHIGSSSTLPQSSPDASIEAALTLLPINLMTTMIDWIFSGVFIRVPEFEALPIRRWYRLDSLRARTLRPLLPSARERVPSGPQQWPGAPCRLSRPGPIALRSVCRTRLRVSSR